MAINPRSQFQGFNSQEHSNFELQLVILRNKQDIGLLKNQISLHQVDLAKQFERLEHTQSAAIELINYQITDITSEIRDLRLDLNRMEGQIQKNSQDIEHLKQCFRKLSAKINGVFVTEFC